VKGKHRKGARGSWILRLIQSIRLLLTLYGSGDHQLFLRLAKAVSASLSKIKKIRPSSKELPITQSRQTPDDGSKKKTF